MRIPYIQHIGEKHNLLTILDFERRGKTGFYLCKCECGKLKWINCDSVLMNRQKGCGCIKGREFHEDITGKKYGKLKVIEEAERKNKRIMWKCLCDCGNVTVVSSNNLKYGHTQSCGCYQRKRTKEGHIKHGGTYTRLFTIYQGMKRRCYSEKEPNYRKYGGRGIKICEQWLGDNGFENFRKWAFENGYNDNLTIDRIDFNGNYEPSNCRWGDFVQQANNRRSNRVVEYKNQRKTIAEWSRETGIPAYNISYRLRKNKPLEEVFKK